MRTRAPGRVGRGRCQGVDFRASLGRAEAFPRGVFVGVDGGGQGEDFDTVPVLFLVK